MEAAAGRAWAAGSETGEEEASDWGMRRAAREGGAKAAAEVLQVEVAVAEREAAETSEGKAMAEVLAGGKGCKLRPKSQHCWGHP